MGTKGCLGLTRVTPVAFWGQGCARWAVPGMAGSQGWVGLWPSQIRFQAWRPTAQVASAQIGLDASARSDPAWSTGLPYVRQPGLLRTAAPIPRNERGQPPRRCSQGPAETRGTGWRGQPRVQADRGGGAGDSAALSARRFPPGVGAPVPSVQVGNLASSTSTLVAGSRVGALWGQVSWYAYKPGQGAAGPALRTWLGSGWRGTRVRVCTLQRCVVVTLTDFMRRADRLVDLDSRSFSQLAPLSVGVVRALITVELGAPVPTAPATPTGPPTDYVP